MYDAVPFCRSLQTRIPSGNGPPTQNHPDMVVCSLSFLSTPEVRKSVYRYQEIPDVRHECRDIGTEPRDCQGSVNRVGWAGFCYHADSLSRSIPLKDIPEDSRYVRVCVCVLPFWILCNNALMHNSHLQTGSQMGCQMRRMDDLLTAS